MNRLQQLEAFVEKCREAEDFFNHRMLAHAEAKLRDAISALDQPAVVGEDQPLLSAGSLKQLNAYLPEEFMWGDPLQPHILFDILGRYDDLHAATPSTEAGVCENCGTKLHPSSCHCCGHTVTSPEAVEQIDEQAEFEKWFQSQWPLLFAEWKSGGLQEAHEIDVFTLDDIELQWEAFQAGIRLGEKK